MAETIGVPAKGVEERGPAREGDLSIETRGIEPVPESQRYGAVWRTFTVWFAPNMVPPAFFVGTLAAADFLQLGFASGLAAIILGNLIGSSVVGLMATMGPRTGMPQLALARLPFGRAVTLPAGINWLNMIAWDAFDTLFGAAAFSLLTGAPFWVSALLVIALQLVFGVIGYEAIHSFQKIMAGVLAVVFIIVAVRVADIGNFSRADGFAGGDRIGAFVLMTTIVASFVLGWAPYGADYTRYLAKTASGLKIYGYTVAGLTVAAGWLQILGLGVAEIVTGNSVETIRDDVLGGGALGAIAMVAIFLGIISVNVMNDYTGSLSLIAAGVRIPRPISAVIVGGAAFALVLWLNSADFAEKFVNYLLLISYWVAAFAGVVLTDWWLRKKRADVTGLLNLTALPIRTNAIIAFVAGVGASVPFMSTSLYVGPVASDVLHYADVGYYVGFLVAGSVYWTLSRFLGERLAVRLAASSSP